MVKLLHHAANFESAPPTLPPSVVAFAEEQFERLQPNELVKNAVRGLIPHVADDFVEDIISDTIDMNDLNADAQFKATYPAGEMSTSSFTILKQPTLDINCRTVRSKNSPESFLKIVANAYSGIQRMEGMSTKLQCNLISQQPDTDNIIIHGFEFENEIEYWTFVGEIKRSIACIHSNTKPEDAMKTGFCHFIPSPVQNLPDGTSGLTAPGASVADKRKSGHGGGLFGSLFATQKEVVPKNHRWEVNAASLVIVDTHSQFRVGVAVGAITDTIVGSFDLHDLVALTLSVDYHAPSAAILVASLAHAERDRDKVKEADPTKICTSSAYSDMVLDVKLKRAKVGAPTTDDNSAAADGNSGGSSAQDGEKKAKAYRCVSLLRRGVGEMTVLPLSEEDLLYAELSTGTKAVAPSAADTTPATPAPPALVPTNSLSPKGFGMMGLRGPAPSAGAALAHNLVYNSLSVSITDRHDPGDVLGTHSLSCAELTKPQYSASAALEARGSKSMATSRNSGTGASTESMHDSHKNTSASDATNKGNSKSPSTSMFGSFYRSKPDHTVGSTGADGGDADSGSKAGGPAKLLKPGKADFSPHPTGLIPLSGGAAVPRPVSLAVKVIKYHDPVFCDVELVKKASLKAARLVIKRANDLPSSSPALAAKHIPPTVYATVYLVDANGEKRSINSVDSRTEAIKSFDPEWNKEVLLQNEKQGVDDIVAVMVLFRDSSLGMLKHHHIGRVNIPFSCFLDNTQADFCLPLEPTYRMNEDDSERLHLGDVHFTTELIEMGPGNKRVTSIVRAASSTTSTAAGPHPAFTENETSTSTTASAADAASAGAGANAPTRRMTIIGSTGSKGKSHAVALRYCLYRATADSVWWPVRLLKTVLHNSTAVVTPAGPAPTGWIAPSFSSIAAPASGLRSDSVGYIWCGYRSILIDLLPGVTGVLYNCQECSTEGQLTVTWQNVLDCLDVSDSAVLLTLRINTCTSNATQISRQEFVYAPAIISLMVGPCQAAALRREFQQRAQFSFVRDNLSELAQAVNAINGANIPITQLRSISLTRTLTPPSSPMKVADGTMGFNAAYNMAPGANGTPPTASGTAGTAGTAPAAGASTAASAASAATGGAATTLTQLLAANNAATASTSAVPTLMDILPMARSVALALEGIIQHTEALLNHSLLLSLDDNKLISSTARGVLTPILLQLNPPWFNALTADLNNTKKTILPLYSPIVKDRQCLVRTMARAKVYFAFLRHVCGRLLSLGSSLETSPGFALPEFSTEAIQKYVKLDCENVQLFTPLRAGAKIETMITRFESFLEAALERTRDYLLFSGANWDVKPSAMVSDPSAATKRKSSNPVLPSQSDLSGKECIQVLIESYYRTILNYLKPFIGNKEAFRKIAGQDVKNCVLKLLIENNLRYDMSTQLTVGVCLDMKVVPTLPLVEDVNTIIEWYSDSLLHDTRGWLIRTLQNAGTERRNKSNLPWDVEVVGDKIISFLPETLRFQLNVYTELCSVHLTTSAYDDAEMKASAVLDSGLAIGLGMNMPSGMQIHPTVPVAPSMNQSAITARVNEMILHAVCEALVLLAEEYHRALQGRHWDKIDTATGKLAVHVEFLSAVANDCHRVLSVHMSELQATIKATPQVHEARKVTMVQTFSPPADIALRHIMRIIFTDVQSTLIDLDSIWTNPRNLGARTLTAAISAHLRTLKTALVPDLYFKLVGNCVQVVVTRYVLLLKNRCLSKSSFTMDDILRFVRDVATIKQCFSAFLSEADTTTTSSASDDGEESSEKEPSTAPPGELEPPANLDDITQGTAAGKYFALSSFQAIDTMCHLLSAEYDTAVFHRKALNIVERYEGIPAGSEFKHKLEKEGNMVAQTDQNIVSVAVLLSCISTLRADSGPDLTSFLSAILLGHQHSHNAQGSRACKPILNSPAFPYDVIVKVFAAPLSTIAAANATSNGGETDSKGGLKGLFSPAGSALKHLREKAADIAVKKGPAMVPAVKARQNEESAMEIMRTLGLEVQSRVKAADEKETNTQVTRRPSGKDIVGLGVGGVPTANGEGSAARNLQADLGGEHGHGASSHDLHAAEKGDKGAKKKKNGIFGHLHLPHVGGHGSKHDAATKAETGSNAGDDSSSESEHGTDTPAGCMILIEAIEVRALHSSSFIGGPNPYVYFSVSGRKHVKTSVKWDHKEASWSEKVEIPASMQDIQEGRITIKVFDKERMRRKRLVGAVTVKLAPLEYHSFESWYALEGGEQTNYGEVHCRMRLVTDTTNL